MLCPRERMLHHRLNCSHIYYVYVYKSLRRPHIPEACKERWGRESDGAQEAGRDDATEAGDRREDVWRAVRRWTRCQPGVSWLFYICYEVINQFAIVVLGSFFCWGHVKMCQFNTVTCVSVWNILSGACTASVAPRSDACLIWAGNIFHSLRVKPPHRPQAFCSHLLQSHITVLPVT